MIDNFAIGITHALMMLAAVRLMWRADLDDDSAPPVMERPKAKGFARKRDA